LVYPSLVAQQLFGMPTVQCGSINSIEIQSVIPGDYFTTRQRHDNAGRIESPAPHPCSPLTLVRMYHLVRIRLGEDVLDCLLDAVDSVGFLVGNLNAEFLLDCHDNLHGVKAVKTQVVVEVRFGVEL